MIITYATNGVLELTEEQKNTIRNKLLQIKSGFEGTEETPELSTHGLVSSYNCANPDMLINGDTAEYLLSLSE
jgi:hypothetical protein